GGEAGGAGARGGDRRGAPGQRGLLQRLAETPAGLTASELDRIDAGWRPGARALQERGWLEMEVRAVPAAAGDLTVPGRGARTHEAPVLSAAQEHAVATIDAAADCYGSFLLQGVTGRGKTEGYPRLRAPA